MLRLCGFRVSNYHNKVRLVLLEKGIAHEEDDGVRPAQDAAFLAKSPMGKVPYLVVNGGTLAESQVIVEYLEERFPEPPLLPREPLARARVRELVALIELHLELVARRLYGGLFFAQPYAEETAREVERELEKGVRAFARRARFAPWLAGSEFSLADCVGFAHLPLVALAARKAFGRDPFAEDARYAQWLARARARPAFARVDEERRAAQAAMASRSAG